MSYVFPTSVCVVRWRGGRVHLNPDHKWPADDPFVQERPEFFDIDPQAVQRTEPPVERATRAPGESRPTRRPGGKSKGGAAGG